MSEGDGKMGFWARADRNDHVTIIGLLMFSFGVTTVAGAVKSACAPQAEQQVEAGE